MTADVVRFSRAPNARGLDRNAITTERGSRLKNPVVNYSRLNTVFAAQLFSRGVIISTRLITMRECDENQKEFVHVTEGKITKK